MGREQRANPTAQARARGEIQPKLDRPERVRARGLTGGQLVKRPTKAQMLAMLLAAGGAIAPKGGGER